MFRRRLGAYPDDPSTGGFRRRLQRVARLSAWALGRPAVHRAGRPAAYLLTFALSAVLLPKAGRGGTIFDDDSAPPPRAAATVPPAPPPAPVTPPASPAATPAPPSASPAVPLPAPPAAVSPSRRPVPPGPDLARSRTLLKQAYAEELKDPLPAARLKLAQKLIDVAAKTVDTPSDQFVLLGGAVTAAQEAKSLPLCVKAGDLLAAGYRVDGLGVKATAALNMTLRGDTAAASQDNVRAGLDLVGQLIDAGDFPTASRLCTALAIAAADPAMKAAVHDKLKLVNAARSAEEQIAPAVAKLKIFPDDPAANAAYGNYLCFYRGSWDLGLPFLVKGTDVTLQALATRDVTAPKAAQEQFELGSAWWDAAEKLPDGEQKTGMRSRAADWYERAKSRLPAGLSREIASRRVADTPPPVGRHGVRKLDLLAILDLRRDVLVGEWSRQGADLACAAWKRLANSLPVPPAD